MIISLHRMRIVNVDMSFIIDTVKERLSLEGEVFCRKKGGAKKHRLGG